MKSAQIRTAVRVGFLFTTATPANGDAVAPKKASSLRGIRPLARKAGCGMEKDMQPALAIMIEEHYSSVAGRWIAAISSNVGQLRIDTGH